MIVPFIDDSNSCRLTADLARSLNQVLLAFLDGNGFTNFLGHIGARLVGNGSANVTNLGNTFLGRDGNAGLLFLQAAIFLGVVSALLAVNAVLPGNVPAVVEGLLVTDFLGLLVADFLLDISANGSGPHGFFPSRRDDLRGIRSARRNSEIGTFVLLTGLLIGFLVQASLPDAMNRFPNLRHVATLLDGMHRTDLFEMSYANVLLQGLAFLLEDFGTNRFVGALLLPNDVAERNGNSLAFLLHDVRARLLFLGVAFSGLSDPAIGYDLLFASVIVLGPAFFLPDFVENRFALSDVRNGMNGSGYDDAAAIAMTFILTGLQRSLKVALGSLDSGFLLLLQGLEVVGCG